MIHVNWLVGTHGISFGKLKLNPENQFSGNINNKRSINLFKNKFTLKSIVKLQDFPDKHNSFFYKLKDFEKT